MIDLLEIAIRTTAGFGAQRQKHSGAAKVIMGGGLN